MFRESPFHTPLSVNAVIRSFSSASFALEINSRMKISLYYVNHSAVLSKTIGLLMRVQAGKMKGQSALTIDCCMVTYLFITILRRRATSLFELNVLTYGVQVNQTGNYLPDNYALLSVFRQTRDHRQEHWKREGSVIYKGMYGGAASQGSEGLSVARAVVNDKFE
jgi:hypothetical protein